MAIQKRGLNYTLIKTYFWEMRLQNSYLSFFFFIYLACFSALLSEGWNSVQHAEDSQEADELSDEASKVELHPCIDGGSGEEILTTKVKTNPMHPETVKSHQGQRLDHQFLGMAENELVWQNQGAGEQ